MSSLKNSVDLVANKVVLLRLDLNVPVADNQVTSDARILAVLPTINFLLEQNSKIVILAHRGRPTEGEFNSDLSLEPIAKHLAKLIEQEVVLQEYADFSKPDFSASSIVMLENVRFNKGEKADDIELAKKYAALGDVFVMDAFGCAHRQQASITGLGKVVATVLPGILMRQEIDNLEKIVKNPQKPIVTIVGGSKVSTKFSLLKSLAQISDYLIVGGGIANTFLAAKGCKVGNSLYERDCIDMAQEIMALSNVELPKDVVVATKFDKSSPAKITQLSAIADDEMILDVGPLTAQHFDSIIAKSGSILVNGPVGVFEIPQFAKGTESLMTAIAKSNAFSVAGGGDTIAALEKFNLVDNISYISTGGGAFLEYLEGKILPGIAILSN